MWECRGGCVTACRVGEREGGSTLRGLAVDPTLMGDGRAWPPSGLTWFRVVG